MLRIPPGNIGLDRLSHGFSTFLHSALILFFILYQFPKRYYMESLFRLSATCLDTFITLFTTLSMAGK